MLTHFASWFRKKIPSNRDRLPLAASTATLARKSLALVMSFVIGPALLLRPLELTYGQAGQPAAPATPTDVPQATFANLWRVDANFQSTIRMKNLLPFRPFQVTPALYMADGTEYDLPPVTLAASAMADVDVNQALANAPPMVASHLSNFGSAALKYMSFWPGAVAGELTMLDVPRSLVFASPFQMMMPTMMSATSSATQTLEGLWWKHDPSVGGFVSITNTTDRSTNVTLQVIGEHGATLQPETVSLASHAAKMLDLGSLTSGLAKHGNQVGGLRVQYPGQMGDVEVSGGLENASEGYSANMPFWQHDPSPLRTAIPAAANTLSLAAVGVMVGQPDPNQGFPSGTHFAPYLALRNTTERALKLNSTLYVTSGNHTQSFSLPAEELAPHQARQVDIAAQLKELRLQDFNGSVNLTVSYTGVVADLLMAAGSVDQTGTYVFAVLPQLVEQGKAKDVSWMVGNGYDTMLALWNPSSQPEDLLATFSNEDGSGAYKLPVHLEAYASVNIDMAKLIAAQQPDANGNVIPAGAMQGRVTVSSPQDPRGQIYLNLTASAFNATTATCCPNCICCFGTASVAMSPSSATINVGDTLQLQFQNYEWGCFPYCTDNLAAQWSSDEPASATVGNNQSNAGLVTAQAGGSATITASVNNSPWGTICSCSPGCPTQNFPAQAQVTTKANVQITLTTVSPGTIHTGSNPTNADVTVTIYHQAVDPNRPQSVLLTVSTYSTNPQTGVSVSYNPTNEPVPIAGPAGSFNANPVNVAGANIGSNSSATVNIIADLSNASSGLTIVAPNPVDNAHRTLTVQNP